MRDKHFICIICVGHFLHIKGQLKFICDNVFDTYAFDAC